MTVEQIELVTTQTKLAWRQMYAATEDLGKYLNTAKASRLALPDLRTLKKTTSTIAAEVPKIKNVAETASKAAKQVKTIAETANTTAKESKTLWDTFLSKIPGGGNNATKAGNAGTSVAALFALAGLTVAVTAQALVAGIVQKTQDARVDKIDSDLTKVNGVATQAQAQVKAVQAQVKEVELSEQRTKDRVYGLEKQNVGINNGIEKADKKANDALYESRKGTEKIESLKADYQAFKAKAEAILKTIDTNFQKSVKETIATIQKGIDAANSSIDKVKNSIPKAVEGKPGKDGKNGVDGKNGKDGINGRNGTDGKNGITTVVTSPGAPGAKGVPGQRGEIGLPGRDGKDGVDGKNGKDGKNGTDGKNGITTTITLSGRDGKDGKDGKDAEVDEQTKALIRQTAQNAAYIPALAARPAPLTSAETATAAATGVCQTSQPNGCLGKALKNTADDVKINNNNNTGSILDAINTGGTAALLAGQQTILSRLGAQVQGGISAVLGNPIIGAAGQTIGLTQYAVDGFGKAFQFFNWAILDRVLNLLTTAATIHNAAMLSNDIGQTLLGAIGNILQVIGIKDSSGQAYNLTDVIGKGIEAIIKDLIGESNYQQLSTNWAKANRIYQASVNILNTFQGLASTILTALEMTAGKVAKIGNALRRSGEVLESAYGWMNPQPKFNKVTETLESLQNGASTIQMVTQAPLDIINATTELTTATTELTNAIKQDENPVNKGKEAPEPDKLKADEAAAKTASVGLELIDLDLDPDD